MHTFAARNHSPLNSFSILHQNHSPLDKIMNPDNYRAQMRKGMLEYCILLVLSRGDAYASEILARLKAADLIVVEGTIYPLLTRLKNDGLLIYRWEESTQGPPRKYYSLTNEGAQALDVLESAWTQLSSVVTNLKENSQQ